MIVRAKTLKPSDPEVKKGEVCEVCRFTFLAGEVVAMQPEDQDPSEFVGHFVHLECLASHSDGDDERGPHL